MKVMLRIAMPELLPAINIAVAIEPSAFLEKMAEIGRRSERFDVEDMRHSAAVPDLEIINFRFKEESPHDGLGFQLIFHRDSPNRVSVEVRAGREATQITNSDSKFGRIGKIESCCSNPKPHDILYAFFATHK